jgi:L-lactate utilization protein LutC
MGKGKPNKGHLQNMLQWESLRAEAWKSGVPASVKELQIAGKDALDRGLTGAEIGLALRAVLDEVVVRPGAQTLSREWQLKRLHEFTT